LRNRAAVLLLSVITLAVAHPCCSAKTIVKTFEKSKAAILYDREIYLEISARSEKEFSSYSIDLVVLGNSKLSKFRRKRGFAFKGKVYRFPYSKLSIVGKSEVIKCLFPNDRLTGAGWDHEIRYTGSNGETLWRLAVWFTGTGTNSSKLQKINRINPRKLSKGKHLIIPSKLLLPGFGTTESYPATVGELIYKKDAKGVYAQYTLKKGQTIYSDIVLRFTPRVTAQEVMEAARQILKRSNLKDFRFIPAGAVLKIPVDLISPQNLPSFHTRRVQYEKTLRESGKYQKKMHALKLEGVMVILDSGHGGVDPGALGKKNEHEDEYAYDILCRVKKLLESTTKAKVFVTLQDDETGFDPQEDAYLKSRANKEKILTHPPYYIRSPKIGLNLRWFLANYLYDKEVSSGNSSERIVFTSFHMDSLHKTAQGLMVYIPGADFYKGRCHLKSSDYLKYKEVKGRNKIRMSRTDRLRAEGLSRAFAKTITHTCRKKGLQLHSNQPVRNYIIRKRHPWVPAVLKYCKIPTRILVELANLQNDDDLQRIRDPKYREKLAETYVDSLVSYFENNN